MRNDLDQNGCEIIFLDCRGYYDLAAEILGLVGAIIILYRSLSNYRQLRSERIRKVESEYKQNQNRKININLLNIIYLLVFALHIIFSMIIFQMLNEKSNSEVMSMQLEKWYKFTEVLYVQLLNGVLLCVGWLYWRTLHCFYVIKRLEVPLFYHQNVIYLFGLCGFYFVVALIVPMILVFLDEIRYKVMINIIILVSSALAVTFFIIFRIMYYKNIFKSIKFSKSIIRKQQIYNFIILFCGIFRIGICVLLIHQQDFEVMRNYSNDCHDLSPLHGIFLLFMSFIVNLLPSFIFTNIFTTFQKQKATKSDIQRTLFSAQNSEYESKDQK